MSDLISVVIPSRNEIYLNKTVEDILKKAEGNIEVIVTTDGYWSKPIIEDEKVRYIHLTKPRGMRNAINMGVAVAKGKYILKSDAHCLFDEGFDIKLMADMQSNWVVIPQRKRLDAENWCVKEIDYKPDVDYEYLSYPGNPKDWGGAGLHGRQWNDRTRERKDILIDDNPTFQGSCFFIEKEYFHFLELEDDVHYGYFNHEAQEICLKTWLSGGKVKTNKNTFYCHWHKGKESGRGYALDNRQLDKGTLYTNQWITNSAWNEKQIYDFSSFIEYFMPMPEWDKVKLAEIKKYDKFHRKIGE